MRHKSTISSTFFYKYSKELQTLALKINLSTKLMKISIGLQPKARATCTEVPRGLAPNNKKTDYMHKLVCTFLNMMIGQLETTTGKPKHFEQATCN